MVTGLAERVSRLERRGGGGGSRWIRIGCSTDYAESWVERVRGGLEFHVRVPSVGCDPDPYLTPEMRDLIRPNDVVVIYDCGVGGRREDAGGLV
jgi:hypothetical protein